MTGYENIVTLGLYLALTMREIRERMAGIAEFTELGDFLSMPAATYSSGMLFRLGFATSTRFCPDILLMDEWLTVALVSGASPRTTPVTVHLGNRGIRCLNWRSKIGNIYF